MGGMASFLKKYFHTLMQTGTPTYNILIMGVLNHYRVMVLSYQVLQNIEFGAFLAFMGVNLATFRQFFSFGPKEKK
jgi:hypothetical protein